MRDLSETSGFLFYTGIDGAMKVEVILGEETVWTTQKGMAEIFDTSKQNISYHVSNVIKEGELSQISTVKEILTVQTEGGRDVSRKVEFYNLDMIIAVGYRVNSYQATQFRIWATKVLKEYLLKGFALDDERLKQGKGLFGKDFFNELLERIREIRASERRFYQKITDIYRDCSIDYDQHSPVTQTFYATVQNKLHWAIHNHTAAELINLRANSAEPNMGLKTWKNAGTGGKILKSDVGIAKNYLTKEEITQLNRLVTMYLDFAENMAQRQKALKMQDWAAKLDSFLQFNEYDILKDAGRIKHEVATILAQKEYEKYRVIQDREYISDFDRVVDKIKISGQLPDETGAPKKQAKLKKPSKKKI